MTDFMRAWTVQSADHVRTMDKTGVMRASWRHYANTFDRIDHMAFSKPYSWLTAQYNARVERLRRPPIWIAIDERPDMRWWFGGPKRRPTDLVRLTCYVPTSRVLMYAADTWAGCVLNTGAIVFGIGDADWEQRVATVERDRRQLRASWAHIFDIERCRSGEYGDGLREGIIAEILPEWVVKREIFPRGQC